MKPETLGTTHLNQLVLVEEINNWDREVKLSLSLIKGSSSGRAVTFQFTPTPQPDRVNDLGLNLLILVDLQWTPRQIIHPICQLEFQMPLKAFKV